MAMIRKIEPKIPEKPTRPRVAAYARVSVDNTDTLHSLSAQVSFYNAQIQENPQWEFAGVYVDRGISGTNTAKREEFQRLITDCEKGLINIVLTKSISRFARNTVDLLDTVRKLKLLDVEVRFEKEGINSLSADGEVMLSILASFAQEESRNISENIKWSVRKGYEAGKPRTVALFGYKAEQKSMVIVPEQAEVVRMIFQEFLTGKSCYVIATELNKKKVPSYQNKTWTSSRVSEMIRQEKYMGDILHQKVFIEDCLTHKKIENEGQLPKYYVEENNPPIIERELFQQVQEELARRYGVPIVNGIAEPDYAMGRGNKKKRVSKDYPRRKSQWSPEMRADYSYRVKNRGTKRKLRHELSVFIKCEVCGNNFICRSGTFTDGSDFLRWECKRHTKKHSLETKPTHLNDDVVKKIIAEALGVEEFKEKEMTDLLTHISVKDETLTFHFKDGNKKTRNYPKQTRGNLRKKRKKDGNCNNNTCDIEQI